MSGRDPFLQTLRVWSEIFMRHSMRSFLQYNRDNGFSMSQTNALFHLNRKGRCAVSDLGDHLEISNAATSQMLERLVQQGLISRDEDSQDRRVKKITLTDKGKLVVKEGLEARQHWLLQLETLLNDEEKEKIVVALEILIDKSNQLENTPELDCGMK